MTKIPNWPRLSSHGSGLEHAAGSGSNLNRRKKVSSKVKGFYDNELTSQTPCLVIGNWDLIFICNLVLVIWNFHIPKQAHATISYFTKCVSIIRTCNFRLRGPSNSQKKIPCQVPSTNRPFSMAINSDAPTRVDLT